MWSGAVSPFSAKVNAKLTQASSSVRLVVDETPNFSSPYFSSFYSVDSTTNFMVAMEITGLTPFTVYYYAVESDGIMDTSSADIGSFKTFASGSFSYSFVLGSCALDSDHKVYSVMDSLGPLFYLNMGDLHYANPNSATDINVHRLPYETEVLSKPAVSNFLKHTPIAYIWDDHDFSGNSADSSALGKENARIAYHEYVPHYPLGLGTGPNFPINQSFTIGRIHFILTDLRSERSTSSIMSDTQMTWLENQCLFAKNNGLMIAWVSTATWNNTTEVADNWYLYSSERLQLSDFLNSNGIENLFILSGDAHMIAIDDGTNANFSTSTTPYLYPIFQASALNQNGSYKGGIFNQGGYFMNPLYTYGQFGKVDVTDNGGDSICIEFSGYRVDSSGNSIQLLNNYSFCRFLPLQSINENVSIGDFSISPNPSSSLKLTLSNCPDPKCLRVYSLTGELVFMKKMSGIEKEISAELPALESSQYIVEIETSRGNIRKSWLKK